MSNLASYSLLGRSGLRVSPLCLGTMTFGTDWGWGADAATCHRLIATYLEGGGNFIDTADGYTSGTSETIIGDYFAQTGTRDRAVLATKFSFNAFPGDPNAGGNSRKNIHRALEGSLKRLKTDYIDLYWLHAWDGLTPVEEVMRTLTDLVRAGKVRYIGLSDVPAWYFARAQTLAERDGLERIAALQLEYSLVERNIEREHIPAALELGAGITPWSPLASGLLSGKYTRDGVKTSGAGRLDVVKDQPNPAFTKLFTERNWQIIDELIAVAKELDRSPAQVALSWVAKRPHHVDDRRRHQARPARGEPEGARARHPGTARREARSGRYAGAGAPVSVLPAGDARHADRRHAGDRGTALVPGLVRHAIPAFRQR